MAEVAENILVLNIQQPIKALKEANAEQSKFNDNVKKAAEISATAFSGRNIESYADRLKRLNDELNGQVSIIKKIKQEEIELQAQNKKLSNDQKVDLKSAQQMQREIQKEIKSTTQAQKEHTKELERTNNIAKTTSKTFEHLAKIIIGAFSVEKVFEFMKESSKMYLEAQRNEYMLENALKGRKSKTESLIGFAKQLKNNSIISKDIIISQEQYLANLRLSEPLIKKIIQAAADWSAVDPTVSFESAVKSLSATITRGTIEKGIAKVIGSHKELTKEQIQGGAAVELFAKQFQGAALSLSQTDFGKLEVQKNSIKELREKLGKTIVESGVEKFWIQFQRNAIAGAAGTIANWRNIFKEGNEKLLADADVIFNFVKTNSGKYVSDVVSVFDAMNFEDIKKNIDQVRANFILTFVREGESNKDAADLWDMYFARRLETAKKFNKEIEIPLKDKNEKDLEYLHKLENYNKEQTEKLRKEQEKRLEEARKMRENEIQFADKTSKDIIDIEANKTKKIIELQDQELQHYKKIQQEKVFEASNTDKEIIDEKNRTNEASREIGKQETDDSKAQNNIKLSDYVKYGEDVNGIYNDLYDLKSIKLNNEKQQEIEQINNSIANEEIKQRRIKEINNKYAEKEKERAVEQAWINGALGATKALATSSSWIEGLIAAALVLVETGIYVAQIKASNVAQYEKGVIKIKKGNYKAGIDTIPAMLTEGESVMTAEETKENEDLFMAIRKGKRDEFIRTRFVLPELNKELLKGIASKTNEDQLGNLLRDGISANLNDYELRRKLNILIESGDRNTDRIITSLRGRNITR